jgi:hypothetical protein
MRNESLVQEVVVLVALVRTKQEQLRSQRGISAEEMSEILEDIVCHCDGLMSSMLSSPLTGRMHLDPTIGVTPELYEETLATVLQL